MRLLIRSVTFFYLCVGVCVYVCTCVRVCAREIETVNVSVFFYEEMLRCDSGFILETYL